MTLLDNKSEPPPKLRDRWWVKGIAGVLLFLVAVPIVVAAVAYIVLWGNVIGKLFGFSGE